MRNDFMSFVNVNPDVSKAFAKSLDEHIAFVQEAGRKIGVSSELLAIHDESKWDISEFPGYANHFKGGGAPDEFSRAWLHHIHANPHHWQHWIFSDGYTPKNSQVENGIVEMPEEFALEMIADWMGASRAYQGHWDMTEWLKNNFGKIRLHSRSRLFVVNKLHELGYKFIE